MADGENVGKMVSDQASGSRGTLPIPPISNPLFNALENFDREARERKYVIAECEDSIANFKSELELVSAENKKLAIESEKMELEVKAYKAKYEKLLKEKSLIEAEYEVLSKEMEEAMDVLARKRIQQTEILSIREKRLKLIEKTYEMHIAMYRRNPNIAQLLDKREENKKIREELEEILQKHETARQKLDDLQNQFDEKWTTFCMKCATIAVKGTELEKIRKLRDELKAKIGEKKARPVGAKPNAKIGFSLGKNLGAGLSTATAFKISTSTSVPNSWELKHQKWHKDLLKGLKPKQTPTFKKLDQIIHQSRIPAGRKRIGEYSSGGNSLKSPRLVGDSILDQLRSSIKGTAMVKPMPQANATAKALTKSHNVPIRSPEAIGDSAKEENRELSYFGSTLGSTQALLDKTMPIQSQESFDLKSEARRIPSPSFLPFTATKEEDSTNKEFFSDLFSSPEATGEQEPVDSIFY